MSATGTVGAVACPGCARKFAWKSELAGKRARCKCGGVVAFPAAGGGAALTPRPADPSTRQAVTGPVRRPATPTMAKPLKRQDADDFDALSALAADAEAKAADLPVEVRDEVFAPTPAPAPRKSAGVKPTAGGIPIAYRRTATASANTRAAADRKSVLVDPVRDYYAPCALLAVGLLIYAGFIFHRYHVSAGSLPVVVFGITVMVAIKTALLVGGAILLAGPLSVSFGEVKTAVLKLAAIAVFADGAADWADHALSLAMGGHGGDAMGFGYAGWLVSVGTYWGLMVYLFNMDIGDARLVVVCLGVLSRIIRFAAFMVLFQLIRSGVSLPDPTGVASGVTSDTGSTHVDELKAAGQLAEASKYIADGHQMVAKPSVDGWYAAGCPKVWYELSGRDINGRQSALQLIVQMPANPAKRAKCLDVLKGYYQDAFHTTPDKEDLADDGQAYLEVPMR